MGGAEILQFFQIDGFQHLPELPDRIVEQPWQSVNELTALVALIPVVFVISSGSVMGTIPIGKHDVEIFLTMAQSLYACAALLDLEYNVSNATVLFVLWMVSTAIVEVRLVVGIVFLILAAAEVILQRKKIVAFSAFRDTLRDKIL